MPKPTMQDMDEFIIYLRKCSDPQLRSVYCEEKAAKRGTYAALASIEANSTNIKLNSPERPRP